MGATPVGFVMVVGVSVNKGVEVGVRVDVGVGVRVDVEVGVRVDVGGGVGVPSIKKKTSKSNKL